MVMDGGDTFTQAAYFKRLARLLRKAGHNEIPEKETIAEAVKKAEDVSFTQWFMEAVSSSGFTTILSVHLVRLKGRTKGVTT